MERRDKREAAQLREMNCELAVLQRADGSARFHQGSTRVLAAVFGTYVCMFWYTRALCVCRARFLL